MTANSSGAVFFLGTRAHYQVLQQPESRYDAENGNASTETIYQNPTVDNSGNYIGEGNYDNEAIVREDKTVNGMKRRSAKRRQSEVTLCEDIEMKPALLNNAGESETPKTKCWKRRVNPLACVASFYKRKKRLDTDQIQYLQHLESALQTCTYRECCRCLDCQSRYFDVDESDYGSDDSDYGADLYHDYTYYAAPPIQPDEEDDEVFLDNAPGENTSTDLLLETKEIQEPVRNMSLSSDEDPNEQLDIEVAAGTPVLLNYLLTHPITCNIQ